MIIRKFNESLVSDEEKLEDYFLDYKDRGYKVSTSLGEFHPPNLSYAANYCKPGDKRSIWLSISMDEVDDNILKDIDLRVERLQYQDFTLISYIVRIEKGKRRGSTNHKKLPGELLSVEKTYINIHVMPNNKE